MPRSLVLALGNRLSGADAFGPAVLDQLRRTGLPDATDAIEAGTDLLRHIDDFGGYDSVVLVDAVLGAGGRRVQVIPERVFTTWDSVSHSAHELSAVGCVKLFRTLQSPGHALTKPIVTLVALVLPEEDFGRVATQPEIDEAAAAVYLASCGSAGV